MSLFTIRPGSDVEAGSTVGSSGRFLFEEIDEESQDGDASYVFSPTQLTFTVQGTHFAAPDETIINSVTLEAYVRRVSPPAQTDPPDVSLFVNLNLVRYNLALLADIGESYLLVSGVSATNPATGLAWSPADVRDLLFGVVTVYNQLPRPEVRCTQLYAIVDANAPTHSHLRREVSL